MNTNTFEVLYTQYIEYLQETQDEECSYQDFVGKLIDEQLEDL